MDYFPFDILGKKDYIVYKRHSVVGLFRFVCIIMMVIRLGSREKWLIIYFLCSYEIHAYRQHYRCQPSIFSYFWLRMMSWWKKERKKYRKISEKLSHKRTVQHRILFWWFIFYFLFREKTYNLSLIDRSALFLMKICERQLRI